MKKISRVLLLIMAVSFLFLCSGCILDSDDGNENEVWTDVLPENLDPALYTSNLEEEIILSIFKRLINIENGEIVLSAAESYTVSSDGLRYTFIIKDGETWSDGEPVTAGNYAFSLQRILSPDTYSPYAERFSAIESVSSEDDYTLSIVLSHPDNRMLYFLASAAASPCREDFFRSTHGRYGLSSDTIIGNGLWKITTWDLESGKLRIRGREETEYNGYSILYQISSEESVEQDNVSDGKVYGIFFNTQSGLFAQNSARLAILKDIPEEYRDTISGFSAKTDAGLCYPEYDSAEARTLYRDGLSSSGQYGEKLKLLVSEESGVYDRIASLSQIWQRDLGLYFSIEVVSENELSVCMESGEYDAAIISLGSGCGEPFGELEYFADADDSDYNDLYTEAIYALDKDHADKMYSATEQYVLDQGWFIPLYIS